VAQLLNIAVLVNQLSELAQVAQSAHLLAIQELAQLLQLQAKSIQPELAVDLPDSFALLANVVRLMDTAVLEQRTVNRCECGKWAL
jgi:hypothetical protein